MRRTAALLCLALTLTFAPAASAAEPALYSVDVSRAGVANLAALRGDAGVVWWVELGDLLVVSGTTTTRARAARRFRVTDVEAPAAGEQLYLGHHVHRNDLAISRPGGCTAHVVASSGTLSLVAATPDDAKMLDAHEPGALAPVRRNAVYARSSANEAPRTVSAEKTSDMAVYADAVDPERWRATVADLAAFRTRYVGTDGLAAARDYLAAQFAALGLTVTTPQIDVGGDRANNVVAELRGATRPDDVYIVCGHYDSISEQPGSVAPGAEDNGSGAAAVVELARVFAANPPAATIRFIDFAGEEEGLFGSKQYVDAEESTGDAAKIKAVINMDMIAFSRDSDLDVLLETGDVGRDLQAALADAAAAVTSLRVVTSLHPFGSDHVPFIRAGIPCVLTIENDWDEYPDYHTSRDTMDNVRLDMGGQVIRMNAATLGRLAGEAGPPAPQVDVDVPFSTNRTTIRGGFVQTITWALQGDNPSSWELEYSADGGASFTSFATGIPGDCRFYYWLVPQDARSSDGVVRITGHSADGSTASASTDPVLHLRPDSGPRIKKISFHATQNGDFVVKGRFGDDFQAIEVNGVLVDGTILNASQIDGNTSRKLVGISGDLDTVFPRGVEVTVRVIDLRTGLATPEFRVTR
jgi:hypothetical protein